ncbi:MAG: nuclear transport factor 2 family protein [Steroidobacteraceae bacterium]
MKELNIVEDLLHAYFHGDVGRVMALVTEDFEFHNAPMPKVVIKGPQGMRDLMRNSAGGFPEPIEPGSGGHERLSYALNGDTLLFERVDFWTIRGRAMRLPVCSVWRVRADKVSLWRDYYDLGDYVRQMQSVGITIDTSAWY